MTFFVIIIIIAAVQSPKKRSDITDPSLAIPYPLPDPLLEPPKSVVWGTEYSTKFKSPLGFQYVRGAWVESPKHSPTPRVCVCVRVRACAVCIYIYDVDVCVSQ